MSTENHNVLLIQPLSKEVEELYRHHGTFHEGDSGLDLFIVEDATIKAGETAFLKLGIKCAAYNEHSENVSWLAMPRSSISKTPLRLANSVGLIDAGYRGEVIACLDNIKSIDHTVKKGDRLLQAVFQDLGSFSFKIVNELTKTSRGERGFGSTTTATPIVQSDAAATVQEETPDVIANEGDGREEEKPSDINLENRAPRVAENRKRNSDADVEHHSDQIKKARTEVTSSEKDCS